MELFFLQASFISIIIVIIDLVLSCRYSF